MKYIMLGKTVPEPTNERLDQYVCSAGISIDDSDDDNWKYNLVRLYPLGMRSTPPRWSVSQVSVERNPKDSRKETWKPIGAFGNIGEVPKRDRAAVIKECNAVVSGWVEANSKRLSLAFVQPINPRFYLADTKLENEPDYKLYDDTQALKAKERFAYIPRLKFQTLDGKTPDVMVRDWGIWELMRKERYKLTEMTHKEREEYVGGALRVSNNSCLFVGNYAQHRTSWLIISVLNGI